MAGYKECASCGRRFFSNDVGEYCSTACFSQKSTEPDRKKRPILFYISGACIFLFLFFLFESYSINFFFLIDVPILRGHAKSIFAESEYSGIFYLHEELKEAEGDNDTCSLILEALSGCTFLDSYQWKTKLIQDVQPYRKSHSPDTRRAVLKIIEHVGELTYKTDFLHELIDIETRSHVFSMMIELKDEKFVRTLRSWLSYEDPQLSGDEPLISGPFVAPSEEDWKKAVEVAALISDSTMRNALLLAWIAVYSPYPAARIAAVEGFSRLSWRSYGEQFRSQASKNAGKALRVIKGLAAKSKDSELKLIAQKTIESKSKGIRTGVKFEALSFFE